MTFPRPRLRVTFILSIHGHSTDTRLLLVIILCTCVVARYLAFVDTVHHTT